MATDYITNLTEHYSSGYYRFVNRGGGGGGGGEVH